MLLYDNFPTVNYVDTLGQFVSCRNPGTDFLTLQIVDIEILIRYSNKMDVCLTFFHRLNNRESLPSISFLIGLNAF